MFFMHVMREFNFDDPSSATADNVYTSHIFDSTR